MAGLISFAQDLIAMLSEVNLQPWRKTVWRFGDFGAEVGQGYPSRLHDFFGVGCYPQRPVSCGDKDIDQFMLDHTLADVGAVFDLSAMFGDQSGDSQFLTQPADSAIARGLFPIGVGAAGVRPKTRSVVFAQCPALNQQLIASQYKDRYRHVA